MIVRAIACNQESSEGLPRLQIARSHPGGLHCFVDYIIAESLAECNPSLSTQVVIHIHTFALVSMLHRSTLVHHRLPHSMDPVSAGFMSFPNKISGPAHPHSKHPTIMHEELTVYGYQQHVIHLVDDVADDNFRALFWPS